MVTIGIDQVLSNCAMYEHICLEKIKTLYTSAIKCDDHLHFKGTFEAEMVSTPKIFTDNSAMSPGPPIIVKKCSARKSICLFTEVLDVKNKTAVRRVGASKSKRKAIRAGSMLWSSIPNIKGHTKFNEQINKSLYNWILQHPQVFILRLPMIS